VTYKISPTVEGISHQHQETSNRASINNKRKELYTDKSDQQGIWRKDQNTCQRYPKAFTIVRTQEILQFPQGAVRAGTKTSN
jgi:hypothetical protein